MKVLKLLSVLLLSLSVLSVAAQNEAPKGFTRGKVVLPGNTPVTGFIKDNMRSDASVIVLHEGREINYNGSDLVSAEIGDAGFLCIRGDFFKVISHGELSFLQKASNASLKPIYNGSEALFVNGTEGKIGDYFIYENKSQELKLVSRKTFNNVINDSFSGYSPAIEKAKTAQGNIAELKDAVELYNSRNGK